LPHIGGIEDVCHSIISTVPDDYYHKVICFGDVAHTLNDSYEGVEVIRCGVLMKLFSQSISISLLWEMKKVLKSFDPDIVHFHTPDPLSSVYLLWLLPRKTHLIVHWHSDIIEQDVLYTFYHSIETRLLRRANKILATSPTYIPGSKALAPWQNKLSVIPNTVNMNKLQKRVRDEVEIDEIKKRYKGKKIIFTFGRHVPYKGLKYLIDAAPLISDDAVIVIAGNGPLTSELKKRAVAFPAIHFVGRPSDDALRQYLYASDIFAFPSITRNEAFGIALAEAMYCGLPAVTFTILNSGVNWVCVHEETGLECENGNIPALADAFNRLLADSGLRKRLGANAAKRVNENFTKNAIKEDLDQLYAT
jgi:glycosyltransferase involved in cell wall biosynthesis